MHRARGVGDAHGAVGFCGAGDGGQAVAVGVAHGKDWRSRGAEVAGAHHRGRAGVDAVAGGEAVVTRQRVGRAGEFVHKVAVVIGLRGELLPTWGGDGDGAVGRCQTADVGQAVAVSVANGDGRWPVGRCGADGVADAAVAGAGVACGVAGGDTDAEAGGCGQVGPSDAADGKAAAADTARVGVAIDHQGDHVAAVGAGHCAADDEVVGTALGKVHDVVACHHHCAGDRRGRGLGVEFKAAVAKGAGVASCVGGFGADGDGAVAQLVGTAAQIGRVKDDGHRRRTVAADGFDDTAAVGVGEGDLHRAAGFGGDGNNTCAGAGFGCGGAVGHTAAQTHCRKVGSREVGGGDIDGCTGVARRVAGGGAVGAQQWAGCHGQIKAVGARHWVGLYAVGLPARHNQADGAARLGHAAECGQAVAVSVADQQSGGARGGKVGGEHAGLIAGVASGVSGHGTVGAGQRAGRGAQFKAEGARAGVGLGGVGLAVWGGDGDGAAWLGHAADGGQAIAIGVAHAQTCGCQRHTRVNAVAFAGTAASGVVVGIGGDDGNAEAAAAVVGCRAQRAARHADAKGATCEHLTGVGVAPHADAGDVASAGIGDAATDDDVAFGFAGVHHVVCTHPHIADARHCRRGCGHHKAAAVARFGARRVAHAHAVVVALAIHQRAHGADRHIDGCAVVADVGCVALAVQGDGDGSAVFDAAGVDCDAMVSGRLSGIEHGTPAVHHRADGRHRGVDAQGKRRALPAFVARSIGQGVGDLLHAVGQGRHGCQGASHAVVGRGHPRAVDVQLGCARQARAHQEPWGLIVGGVGLAEVALHLAMGVHITGDGRCGGGWRLGVDRERRAQRAGCTVFVGHCNRQGLVALGLRQGLHVGRRDAELDGVAVGAGLHAGVVCLCAHHHGDRRARLCVGAPAHNQGLLRFGCVDDAVDCQRLKAQRGRCGVDHQLSVTHVAAAHASSLCGDGNIVAAVGHGAPACHRSVQCPGAGVAVVAQPCRQAAYRGVDDLASHGDADGVTVLQREVVRHIGAAFAGTCLEFSGNTTQGRCASACQNSLHCRHVWCRRVHPQRVALVHCGVASGIRHLQRHGVSAAVIEGACIQLGHSNRPAAVDYLCLVGLAVDAGIHRAASRAGAALQHQRCGAHAGIVQRAELADGVALHRHAVT